MNPELAWQAALTQLRGILERNTFDSWVEGAAFVSYDPESGEFAIRSPSPLARQWLTSRLTENLAHILTAILAAPVHPLFLDPSVPAGTIPPETAWNHALSALYQKIDRASYDTWVRSMRLVSYHDGVFTASAGNKYALEWLAEHIQTGLETALQESLGMPAKVRFVVPSAQAESDSAQEPAPALEKIEDCLPPETELILQAARLSLYDLVVRPDQEIFIPGYLMRWIPYLESSLFMILVGFRQAYYLKSGSQPNPDDEFRVRGDEIARWTGLNECTFWRYLADPRLKYFIVQTGDQSWTLDPKLGRVKRSINRYRFTATTPLTPGDAQRLENWLVEAGAHKDPLAALKLALSVSRWDILLDPPPPPSQADLDLFAAPFSVQDVVRHACRAGTLDGETFVKMEDLANRLAAQLMPRQDKVFISWYFLRHWVSRLGASPALFVTLLRDRCYHSPEQRRSSVWVNGGNEEIASRLGLPRPKTVDEWLPPVFDRPQKPPPAGKDSPESKRLWEQRRRLRDGKRAVVGRFVQRSGYRPVQNGSYAWQFEVSLIEPLVEEHQEVYDLLLDMTHAYLVSRDAGPFNALIAALEETPRKSKDDASGSTRDAALEVVKSTTSRARMQDSKEGGEAENSSPSALLMGETSTRSKGETSIRSKGAYDSFESGEIFQVEPPQGVENDTTPRPENTAPHKGAFASFESRTGSGRNRHPRAR